MLCNGSFLVRHHGHEPDIFAHYLHHSTLGPLARGLCGAGVVSAVSTVSSMVIFVYAWQGCRQIKWIETTPAPHKPLARGPSVTNKVDRDNSMAPGHTVHVDFHGSVQCASHTRRERKKTVESISVYMLSPAI